MDRCETFRDCRKTIPLSPLKVSHLYTIPYGFYGSSNDQNWMCELCTFSQIQSQMIMSLGEIRVWPHETSYIWTVTKTRLVIKSITGWDNSMLLATYAGWKSTFSAHWSHDPIVLAIPTVTCWLWQSLQNRERNLKCLNKLTDFKAQTYIVPIYSINIYNMNNFFVNTIFAMIMYSGYKNYENFLLWKFWDIR